MTGGGEVQAPQDDPLATTLPALVTCDLGPCVLYLPKFMFQLNLC